MGYKQLKSDGAAFQKRLTTNGVENFVIALCYLDDLLFLSTDKDNSDFAVKLFFQSFRGTVEALIWYLAIKMDLKKDVSFYSQSLHIQQALEEYVFTGFNSFDTSMQVNFYDEARAHNDGEVIADGKLRNMIGTIKFLASGTRPDIATAVGMLSQYTAQPNPFIFKSVRRLFGYLKSTKNYGLIHKESTTATVQLKFYCDSDFGGGKRTRKSRSGWVEYLNDCPFV